MDISEITKDFDLNPDGLAFLELMRERKFLLKDTTVTARNYNLWKNSGLLVDSSENEPRKTIKLNLVEYVWLYMVRDLRAFGLSFEDIKKLKEKVLLDTSSMETEARDEGAARKALINWYVKESKVTFKEAQQQLDDLIREKNANSLFDVFRRLFKRGKLVLEYFLLLKGLNNKESTLVVYLDYPVVENVKTNEGELQEVVEPLPILDCIIHCEISETRPNSKEEKERWFGMPHIQLPISHYIGTFIKYQLEKSKEMGWLSDEEYTLIKLVRERKANKIEITFQDKKEALLVVTKIYPGGMENALIRNFSKQVYASVSYEIEGGKIQQFNVKEKYKLKEM